MKWLLRNFTFALSFILVQGGLSWLQRDEHFYHDDQDPLATSRLTGSLMPANYNSLEAPPTNGGANKVEFSVVIMNVRDVDEHKNSITLEMNLRIYWTDARLKNLTDGAEFIVINPASFESHLWRPDVFIDRAKKIRQPVLLTKPVSMRLFSDGGIRYSSRISVEMACGMNFKYYPADRQSCLIDLKSYAYPNSILVLGWHGGLTASLVEGLSETSNFYLEVTSSGEFLTVSTSGVYSGIRFTVFLTRKMSYHLLQTYLPSTMFIVVSWLTFVMPQDSGAVAIAMTTLLTMTAMFAAVRQNTPSASYTKAIDIWMVVCMFFVFLALAQHFITMRFRHMKFVLKERKRNGELNNAVGPKKTTHDPNDGPANEDDPSVLGVSYRGINMRNLSDRNENDVNRRYAKEPTVPPPTVPTEDQDAIKHKIEEYKYLGNKIRRIFSMITPASFVFFNIIYWTWLLGSSRQ